MGSELQRTPGKVIRVIPEEFQKEIHALGFVPVAVDKNNAAGFGHFTLGQPGPAADGDEGKLFQPVDQVAIGDQPRKTEEHRRKKPIFQKHHFVSEDFLFEIGARRQEKIFRQRF